MGGVLRSSCRQGGRWGGSSFFGGRNPTPPFFRPIFDPFFGAEDRRLGGSSIFGSEDRKLKIGGFFDLRLRRSKMGGLRSSAPKIEDWRGGSLKNLHPFPKNPPLLRRTLPFFEEPSPPFFLRSSGPKIEEPPPSSIFRAEDWVEDRRGPRGVKFTLCVK